MDGSFAGQIGCPGQQDDSRLVGCVVIGEAGAVFPAPAHQHGKPVDLCLVFGCVRITDFKANMEYTFTLGIEMNPLW